MSADAAVLVTGGTGFVGSTLVRRLAAAGRQVHVLARASSGRDHLADLPLTWHTGDLVEPESIRLAIERFAASAKRAGLAAHVVHAAALISYRTRDTVRSWRVNLEGTRALLDACGAANVARVCHVSSVVAVGQAPDAASALDESAAFDGERLRCDYVTTKRAAEDLVLSLARERNAVVVNPGAIFGPAPKPSNTTLFVASLGRRLRGTLAPPGSLGVVGVEDVARGIELALTRGRSARRYVLVESNWTLGELMALVASELGGRPPRARVPPALWPAVVTLAGIVDRIRPIQVAAPQALRLLGEHYRFDARRAREELGWNPRPFREVLRETVDWMRASGLVA